MRSWPRSAYILIAVLVIVASVASYLAYSHAREAYRAVGFNDGQIHQREQILEAIEEKVKIKECSKSLGDVLEKTEFLSIKADTIYAVAIDE